MKKRILAAILMCLVSASLFACDGSDRGTEDYFYDESVGDGEAYYEVDDEDVTSITVFKNDWAVFNTARKENSPIYSKLKSVIGCDIEALNSSAGTWESQLSLLQADESLPDIFLTNGPDNSYFFKKLIENGDILPISNWVSEEHYPNIYNYLKQFEFMRSNITYSYGKMWYIPSTWHLEKSLYVRQDWIENLNAKLDDILVAEKIVSNKSQITNELRETWKFKNPDTLLEFYRLARAFTLYDPDNNGLNDTTGYVSESNKDMDSWIYIAFDAGWNQFIEEDGTYTYSDVSDNSMYATAFVTRLISEGYMSIDSLTNDVETKQTRFVTGKAGMMYAHNWYNVIISAFMTAYNCSMEEAVSKITMCEPPMGKNGTHGGSGDKGCWQGFCINANMSNARIRKCLEFYDYLLSEEGKNLLKYGIEGVHYNVNEDGTKESLLAVDSDGFTQSIHQADSASMLYALVDWTSDYNSSLITNADIINTRQGVSERNSNFSDYPCVTGDNYVEYIKGCHNLFLETIVLLEKNEMNLFYEPSDSTNYNPTTFSWADLYSVSNAFKNKWKSFEKSFRSDAYGGDRIIAEFTSFVTSGKAAKVNPSDYIFNSIYNEEDED